MFFKGQRIGKYEIMEALGSGGFGAVYLALDTWLAQEVALKVPHQQTEEFFHLLKEPRLQASLDHPNIVRLYTVEKIDGVFFMVMEYVKGETLDAMIRRKNALPLYKALLYFEEVLRAVAHAHASSIIHRDLRPTNIMINDRDSVKITDFGTSTWLEGQPYASTRIGSPPYMAPEQFDGKATYASDIYSIGCIFYEMMTGLPPLLDANPYKIKEMALHYQIKALGAVNTEVPPELERIVMKMLEPTQERRYREVKEVLYHLKVYLGDNDRADYIDEIRQRIKQKDSRLPSVFCWNCRRSIPPFSTVCPFCRTEQ